MCYIDVTVIRYDENCHLNETSGSNRPRAKARIEEPLQVYIHTPAPSLSPAPTLHSPAVDNQPLYREHARLTATGF
ncbi:hypothetical protein B5X24_HaOG207616 [Helicoverpa armigera]|nr:hypothetical protein B5X24_HaOG207616 [Helicoverpa armigera]